MKRKWAVLAVVGGILVLLSALPVVMSAFRTVTVKVERLEGEGLGP